MIFCPTRFPGRIALLSAGAFLFPNFFEYSLDLIGVAVFMAAADDEPFGGGESSEVRVRKRVAAAVE